jgi:hypothetical protein
VRTVEAPLAGNGIRTYRIFLGGKRWGEIIFYRVGPMWAPAARSIAFPLVPLFPSYAHTATAGQAIKPGKGVKARLMLGFCIKPKGFLPYPPMCHDPLQSSIGQRNHSQKATSRTSSDLRTVSTQTRNWC